VLFFSCWLDSASERGPFVGRVNCCNEVKARRVIRRAVELLKQIMKPHGRVEVNATDNSSGLGNHTSMEVD
jgi:hypothetical protein